jgi:hypothetical protein
MSNDLLQNTFSTTNTSVSFSLWVAASGYQSEVRIPLNAAVVAETTSIIRDARMAYLHTLTHPEIGDEEKREWNAFFARSDVQTELERLAEEAERQFAAGETEEGGFAVE